jgi:uncharacterized protein (TIGR03032 family)
VSGFELIKLAFDEVTASEGFCGWLAEQRLSIAVSKGDSLWLIGVRGDGALSLDERQFGLCVGLVAASPDTLFLATRYQIWRLENGLPPGRLTDEGHDRLFLPQMAWTTGTLLVRDLRFGAEGDVVFVNGLFSCLSRPSSTLSFEPLWLPPFVSGLAPEDRCLLSGLELEGGRAAFVTSGSRSDEPGGWRDRCRDGGVVVSVRSGEVIAAGLSMPCSPLLRDESLWLCCGGKGELVAVDLDDGDVTTVAFLPGFARGLAIRGHHAVVATSRPPRGESFDRLPLAERLRGAETSARCGVHVVDLRSGHIEHSLTFSAGSPEIHALALLEGVRSATSVPFTGGEVQELVTVPSLYPTGPAW